MRPLALAVVALAAARVGGEEVAVDALGGQADTRTDVGAGSVEDVSAWLDDIGFADLKKKFASNVIDGPALREITEEELKELGVKKIGCGAHLIIAPVYRAPHRARCAQRASRDATWS